MLLTSGGITTPIASEGSSVLTYLETKDLYAENQEVIKFVQRLRYIVRDLGTDLKVLFRTRNNSNEAYVSTSLETLTGTALDIRLKGAKLIRLRFEDDSPTSNWLLSEFELWGQLGGMREL